MWKPLDPTIIGHGQHCHTFTVATQEHRYAGFIPLQCDNCAATWVGPPYEPCPWCTEKADQHPRGKVNTPTEK